VAAGLLDPDPLVQVAAAAATLRLDPGNPLADAILDEASATESDEIAELSRAVLTTDRESERRRIEIEHPRGSPDPAADSALVHGTWARRGGWWRPDGRLHHYLCAEEALFPHLYRGPQPFEWSGYFSFRAWKRTSKDWHRQQAADSLAWWSHRKLLAQPDLIGHSYGGSLALLATQAEKQLRGVVLLSPALHRTCLPDPAFYERILHVTAKLDLVLLADLSNARLLSGFRDVTGWRVKRRGLLGHGATHDPRSWASSGLTEHVRSTWLPSLTARP
jgi:pimeloyl-ACP methyl ester carboxylesterase